MCLETITQENSFIELICKLCIMNSRRLENIQINGFVYLDVFRNKSREKLSRWIYLASFCAMNSRAWGNIEKPKFVLLIQMCLETIAGKKLAHWVKLPSSGTTNCRAWEYIMPTCHYLSLFPPELRPRSYQSVATFLFPSRLAPSQLPKCHYLSLFPSDCHPRN